MSTRARVAPILAVIFSVALVLTLDTWRLSLAGEIVRQLILGAIAWGVLIWLLRQATPMERAQVAVVVALATFIEYTFSPGFEVYTYRLGTVPLYVPPGHGMVYLASLRLGQLPWVQQRLNALTGFVVVAGGLWAVAGLLNPGRPDVLGAVWYLCLLGFLKWGPSRALYVGAFFIVSYLEIMGTSLGVWSWAPREQVLGLMGVGNPPSGSAGGYGWFDLYALMFAPAVLRWWYRLRGTRPAGVTDEGKNFVVE